MARVMRRAALIGAIACGAAAAQQPVQVPSLEHGSRAATPLPGHWFAAPGAARSPALVLLHGCSGAYDGRGRLAERYTELAAWLNARGVHALVTDSLTPRGEKELCTQAVGRRTVTQTERRRDALGALRWLAAQPGVDPARLGLLGWSNGGSTVLAATNLRHPEVSAAGHRPSLAVAFYPGCASELKRGYAPSAPLLMLLGEVDDWTPPGPCKELAEAAARADARAVPAPRVEAYADAHHGFDGTAPVRHRADVPSGAQPGRGVHVGGQPEARAASRAALERFLRERWGLVP